MLDRLQKEVNAKWKLLNEIEEDAFPAWQDYLKELGIVKQITAQSHWGEGGDLLVFTI